MTPKSSASASLRFKRQSENLWAQKIAQNNDLKWQPPVWEKISLKSHYMLWCIRFANWHYDRRGNGAFNVSVWWRHGIIMVLTQVHQAFYEHPSWRYMSSYCSCFFSRNSYAYHPNVTDGLLRPRIKPESMQRAINSLILFLRRRLYFSI